MNTWLSQVTDKRCHLQTQHLFANRELCMFSIFWIIDEDLHKSITSQPYPAAYLCLFFTSYWFRLHHISTERVSYDLCSCITIIKLWQVKDASPLLACCNLSSQKVSLNHCSPRRCHNSVITVQMLLAEYVSFLHSLAHREHQLIAARKRPIRPKPESKMAHYAPLPPTHPPHLVLFLNWREECESFEAKISRPPFKNSLRQITRVYLQMINLQAVFFFFFFPAECLNVDS